MVVVGFIGQAEWPYSPKPSSHSVCEIKILGVHFAFGLSGHRREKLLSKLNAEGRGFSYLPDKVILNKFDVFLHINVVPADILLAQNIYEALNRRRPVGRDFYDIVFLLGKTRPNIDYLQSKLKIENSAVLQRKLLERCGELDFEVLAREVEPFLFVPADAKKVLGFTNPFTTY